MVSTAGTLRFRDPIVHFRQEKNFSCAAASFAMLFDMDEQTARKIVNTKHDGTQMYDVLWAFRNHGIDAHMVHLNGASYKTLDWLEPFSCRFPLILSCKFINTSVKNRTIRRYHAVLAANGFIYDSAEVRAVPFDAVESTFNKDLLIRNMIVVDHELPRWQHHYQRAGFGC